MRRAAVLGAGSWGTTFAKVLGDAGIDVTLLARRPEVARVISEQRSNPDYLPGTTLPEQVTATVDANGVHPWFMGALPEQCAALNRGYLNVVDLTIHAALTEDPRAIRQAAMMDPNAAASLTVDQIWELCDALVAALND